jgi:hypothetical protein
MQTQAATPSLPTLAIDAADAAALTAMAAIAAPLPAERPACGWYESSHDLRVGLIVIEEPDRCLFELWALARQGGRSLH